MSGIIGSVGAKALMKTETAGAGETQLQAKDEDATDSADITTQAYVEKYSAVITPTAWMIKYGKNAVLVVEYIIKTDPGAGTVTVQTLVDGADAVEKTLLNIVAGKQTAVHTDILSAPLKAGTSYTVSLEAKNSDAGQTSVIDYCNIYLQLGTNSITAIKILDIDDLISAEFRFRQISGKVWSGAVDTATCSIKIGNTESEISIGASTFQYSKSNNPTVMDMGSISSYIQFWGITDNTDNPMVITSIRYSRVWFE